MQITFTSVSLWEGMLHVDANNFYICFFMKRGVDANNFYCFPLISSILSLLTSLPSSSSVTLLLLGQRPSCLYHGE